MKRVFPYFPIPLLLLGASLLVVYPQLLSGEVFIWGLPPLQFYPWRAYAVDLLREGVLPLWNPYNGAGAPLFANYQSALLYPLNWPSFFLPIAQTMSITAVLHLFIAGWGMWRLTGRLGYSLLGRGVSTLAFGLTSYLVARLGTFPTISTAAWLPWVCWAAITVIESRRRVDIGSLALVSALLLLGGHAQTAWYSLLLTSLFVVWRWWRLPDRPLVALAFFAGGVLLGAGIAALQLMATAELLLTSQRAGGVDFSTAMNFSYSPLRVLNWFSPNFYGNPGQGTGVGAFFEDAVYIGLVPLISALAACLHWLRRRGKVLTAPFLSDAPFWMAVALVAFIFALGRYTPIYPFLYEHVPTFATFQAPVRWHLWTVFALCLLGGMGVSVWGTTRPARRWGNRLTVVCLAALAVGVVGLLTANDATEPALRAMLGALTSTGLIGVAAGLLSRRQPNPEAHGRKRWEWLVLALITLDLTWAAWGLNVTTAASFDHQAGNPSALRSYWPPEAEETAKFQNYFRFDDYRIAQDQWPLARASTLPNLNLLDGIPLLNNFDPLRPSAFSAYLNLIESRIADPDAPQDDGRFHSLPISDWDATTLRLLEVAHVGSSFNEIGQLSALNPQSERAWLVGSACRLQTEEQIADRLTSADWNPRQQVVLADGDICEPPQAAMIGEILSIEEQNTETRIQIRIEQPGWLVLADTYLEGWHAQINGADAPVERGNMAFRAVYIRESGEHSVRFYYQPAWLSPGAWFSIWSLIGAAWLLFRRTPHKTHDLTLQPTSSPR